VGIDNVDVFEVQTAERRFETLNDVFAGQPVVVDEDGLGGAAVMTMSERDQPRVLIARPMAISDWPPA
jgi:hypothetical protein